MAHYRRLQGRLVGAAGEAIRRAHVYGRNDEKLAKVVVVIFDHLTVNIHYAVVDTGGWLRTKKSLVPTEALRASSKRRADFEAHLTKQQIEGFRPFDESELESDTNWSGYERNHRAKWVADAVQLGAKRGNITPTTRQTNGNLQSGQAAARAGGESVVSRIPPVPIGKRVAVAGIVSEAGCAPERSGSESVENFRKAVKAVCELRRNLLHSGFGAAFWERSMQFASLTAS